MPEIISTRCLDYELTHGVDATDTSFAARPPTKTEPSGDGVIECASGGVTTFNALDLQFIGTGANNAVFDAVRIIGWKRYQKSGQRAIWIPKILAEFATVILGNVPGIAGTGIGSSYFFVDTITTVTFGNANISEESLSPANDTPAHVILDTKGSRKVEVLFDLGANATGGNCLWSPL